MLENVKDLLSTRAKDCYRRGMVDSAIVYYINNDNHLGTPISKEMVMAYVDGLIGITNCRLPRTFVDSDLGLHCISINRNLPNLHWGCDFEEYYRANLCKHFLCVHHFIGRIDALSELNEVPCNKKHGRKSKHLVPSLRRTEARCKGIE